MYTQKLYDWTRLRIELYCYTNLILGSFEFYNFFVVFGPANTSSVMLPLHKVVKSVTSWFFYRPRFPKLFHLFILINIFIIIFSQNNKWKRPSLMRWYSLFALANIYFRCIITSVYPPVCTFLSFSTLSREQTYQIEQSSHKEFLVQWDSIC